MKNLLRFEEFTMLLGSIYLFSLLGYSWWVLVVLLLVPDIGMVGYLINPRIGAVTYNLAHSRSVALLFLGLGVWLTSSMLSLIGVVLLCHACMDRMLGYGLKYPDSFWHTHLGIIKRP